MKRIISLLLALVMAASLLPAAHAYSGPAVSSNINDHFYINAQRWTDPIKSTLAPDADGFVRVEYIDDAIVIEQFDQDLQYVSGRELEMELPVYGGVYLCDDYNFVVLGQNNHEERDETEVFRIIRYSKDWTRIDCASIYGANTYEPFQAGCLRFARSGDILYIRTAHKMYADTNGTNHQANVMISVRVSDMTVTDQFTDVLNVGYGYVSHSFNQFVRVDNTTLLAVDHGDYYPRSVVLIRYNASAGQETFTGQVSYVNALPIAESTGHYNDTGVSVGGFEFSGTDYLIAGCSADQSVSSDLRYAQRNIFVTATPKDAFTDDATTVRWLTSYAEGDNVTVSPPHLLKLDSDRFFLIWTANGVLNYCFLDGRGTLDGEIYSAEGALSDCEPILDGNRIVWYVTDHAAPVFYQIDLSSPGAVTTPHVHSYAAVTTEPTCTESGFTTHVCACGDSYTDSYTDPLGHNWKGLGCTRCGETRENPFTDTDPSRFYFEPVLWAVKNGITKGTSATTFSPDASCTRGHVVTFLWRAAGAPEPATGEHPFVDANPSAYYYKAMLWAVEKGITNGTDPTHFSPGQACNRATVVTFLHRAKGSPEPASTSHSFTDVSMGRFYYKAMLWAVEHGVTQGMSPTTFEPDTVCTRAQVVTFLFRAFA